MTPPDEEAEVSLRTLGLPVYLPALIYAIGQGAFAPVIVLSAFDLGASLGTAGLLVALVGIGLILGDIPAGILTDRVGERRAMVISSGVTLVGLTACILADSIFVLAVGVLITGLSTATWQLARQVYVTEVVPYRLRARSLSLLGGLNRIGMFVGPLLGALAISTVGLVGPYWLYFGCAVVAAALLIILPDLPHRQTERTREPHGGTIQVIRENFATLRTLGVAVILVGIVRESRRALIPLWGTFIGLDAVTISLIFGLSGGADMLLFYPAGKLMDQAGRWWGAVPSFIILGIAHLLLPFTSSAIGLGVVAILMGVGNGLGSGIIMTLGADVSPANGRPQFLGAWRMCHDIGRGAGPLLISATIAVASVGAAAVGVGVASLIAAAALNRWIPKKTRNEALALDESP